MVPEDGELILADKAAYTKQADKYKFIVLIAITVIERG